MIAAANAAGAVDLRLQGRNLGNRWLGQMRLLGASRPGMLWSLSEDSMSSFGLPFKGGQQGIGGRLAQEPVITVKGRPWGL